MDIVTIHSTQSKYFVASRKFELPELKLLIDAVDAEIGANKKKSHNQCNEWAIPIGVAHF